MNYDIAPPEDDWKFEINDDLKNRGAPGTEEIDFILFSIESELREHVYVSDRLYSLEYEEFVYELFDVESEEEFRHSKFGVEEHYVLRVECPDCQSIELEEYDGNHDGWYCQDEDCDTIAFETDEGITQAKGDLR